MYKPYIMNDVLEASSKKLFTVISIFAGGVAVQLVIDYQVVIYYV